MGLLSSHWSDLDSSSHNSSASVKHNCSCHIFRQVGHLLKPTSTGNRGGSWNTKKLNRSEKLLWFRDFRYIYIIWLMVEPPIWKICLSKLDHFPKVRGENRKYLKPPPSNVYTNMVVLLSFLVFARYLYLWTVSCWSPCKAALRPNRPSESFQHEFPEVEWQRVITTNSRNSKWLNHLYKYGWTWWNIFFLCKNSKSSNWNNHLKMDVSSSRFISSNSTDLCFFLCTEWYHQVLFQHPFFFCNQMAGILKTTPPLYTHPRLEADIMGCYDSEENHMVESLPGYSWVGSFLMRYLFHIQILYMPKTINHISIWYKNNSTNSKNQPIPNIETIQKQHNHLPPDNWIHDLFP